MMNKPNWTEKQADILESCLKDIKKQNSPKLSFPLISKSQFSIRDFEVSFEGEDHLHIELIKYWAWKEIWDIYHYVNQFSDPLERLILFFEWSFNNVGYLKILPYLHKMKLPSLAIEEIQNTNQAKQKFFLDLFSDKELPKEFAYASAASFLPFYYGWMHDKQDQIHSDIQKFEFMSIMKTNFFREFF